MSHSGPASLTWVSSPPTLALEPNEAHVWLVRADAAELCAACCSELLSSAERERAGKFKFAKDCRLYTAAHAALRSILGGYLKIAPADLHFETGRMGKPRLASRFTKDPLEFNLSHSHELALIAVTIESEIGVDVERVRGDFAFAEIAARYFTAREVIELRALPQAMQQRAFYQCWTAKEALLKARGVGLSGELDEVAVFLDSDDLVQVNCALLEWSLRALDPGEGYVGALALEGEDRPLRCFRWRGAVKHSGHAHS